MITARLPCWLCNFWTYWAFHIWAQTHSPFEIIQITNFRHNISHVKSEISSRTSNPARQKIWRDLEQYIPARCCWTHFGRHDPTARSRDCRSLSVGRTASRLPWWSRRVSHMTKRKHIIMRVPAFHTGIWRNVILVPRCTEIDDVTHVWSLL
jgi:hypothetical protein